MARKEAMTKMREVLLLRRNALRKALAGDLSLLKDLREQSAGDVVDFALDAAQDEISSQLAEVESRELSHVEAALEKMRNGTYGKCEGCGENIPLVRIQALPYASYCITCQTEIEEHGELRNSGGDLGRILNTDDSVIGDMEFDIS